MTSKTIDLTVVMGRDAAGAPMPEYEVRVERDGDVLALDPVSNTYTRCHSLAPEIVAEARRLAALVRAGMHMTTAGYVRARRVVAAG